MGSNGDVNQYGTPVERQTLILMSVDEMYTSFHIGRGTVARVLFPASTNRRVISPASDLIVKRISSSRTCRIAMASPPQGAALV
jgi:hypothetical protein